MSNLKKNFSKIYDQYVEKIYRFIFLKVNSREIAQDLTSETFLKAWEAFRKANNPSKNYKKINNFSAFLYEIARNLVTDYYRQKSRSEVISTESFSTIIDPKFNFEEELRLESDINQIRIALSNLRDDYQNVIIWHYLDDLSIPEIAKMLNKTEANVRVLLHRALQALKNKLNQMFRTPV